MLSKKELQDELKYYEELILSGCDEHDKKTIESYSDYMYFVGKRELLIDMLRPKKRTPKEEVPNKKLQEFGFENPIQRKNESIKK